MKKTEAEKKYRMSGSNPPPVMQRKLALRQEVLRQMWEIKSESNIPWNDCYEQVKATFPTLAQIKLMQRRLNA